MPKGVDVDNFKDIVNTFGYDASRQVLKELGDRVKAILRPIDRGCDRLPVVNRKNLY